MKYLSALSLLFLLACSSAEQPRAADAMHDTAHVAADESYTFDTAAFNYQLCDTLYPAFRFSDKSWGIFLDVEYGKCKLDSELLDVFYSDSLNEMLWPDSAWPLRHGFPVADRSGFPLRKYEKLSRLVLQAIPKRFYVYSSSDSTTAEPVDAVFGSLPCLHNFILVRLKLLPGETMERPLLCSTKPMNLEYGKFPAVEKAATSWKLTHDFTDSIPFVFFARMDSLYYGYADDFRWGRDPKSRCRFPERAVFVKRGESYVHKWLAGPDLFGVACE